MQAQCKGVAVLTSFVCHRREAAALGLKWPVELHRSTAQVVQQGDSAKKFCAFESFSGEALQCWN